VNDGGPARATARHAPPGRAARAMHACGDFLRRCHACVPTLGRALEATGTGHPHERLHIAENQAV
jgi:hypothetical protein